MEDFQSLLLMHIFIWGSYIFGMILHLGIMTAGIIGRTKYKNIGFIFILISGCIRSLHHLPSIYFKGIYAIRRLTPAEYGELMITWSYIDNIVIPLARILLVIGLLFVAMKGLNVKNNAPGGKEAGIHA